MINWSSIIPSLILGATGVFVTIRYSNANKKREDDKILKDLFTEFNKRYDNLNKLLIQIIDSKEEYRSIDEISANNRSIIIDFFNLCAEEYFWHIRGRIDKKIWNSWQSGMNYWYNHTNPIVRDLWKEECKYGKVSYYIKNGDEFFKEK